MASSTYHRRGCRRQLFPYYYVMAVSLLCDVSTNTPVMVQCLSAPKQQSLIPFNIRRTMLPPTIHKQHIHEQTYAPQRRTTALHLFSFDKFLHPYGVNQTTNDSNDEEEYQIELLNALLPKALTTDDKRRIIEGFQRALLDEQLRLARQSRRRGNNNNNDNDADEQFLADDEDMVSSMSDIFQRARLSEQLRLSKNKGVYDASVNYNEDEDDIMSLSDDEIDKDEAFQRALLEERLKSRRIQRDIQLEQLTATIVNSNSIEQAMMEFEEESKQHQMATTMVHENEENEVEDDNNDKSRHDEDAANDAIIISNSSGARDNHDDNNNVAPQLLVNETEGSSPSQHLDEKLTKLHEMVAVAASSSPSSSSEEGRTATRESLQTVLSTAYLPLPPREDASPLSLVLAPIAHLMTSIFMLGAAVFYAAMAVLDVIWNDANTRACMRETSSVLNSCWGYVFPKSGTELKERPAQRTMKAMQTSIIALFYAVQCIIVRGYYHSKHSNACLDACTGSLRYSVYSLQSVKVIWTRIMSTLRRIKQSIERQNGQSTGDRHTLQHLRRLFTNMKGVLSSKRLRGSIRSEQQPQTLPSEELYNQRMRLNQDRVALERDKHQLKDERRKLLVESMNIVAWYSAVAKEATAEEEMVQHQKKHWWNRKS